ncbi:distal tail protein Dit [uncultured Streptococcus sp.]|uniref:distal tail protein Dit n=1 Tax=uncultured Streptococcus sp. TaxID=83427 RepID=UPI00280B4D03|nr:distal tail protein Dit [uncultured Streptococcus sp.]
MTKEMTFNGVDMSRYFRITNIVRPVGNKRSITTDDAPKLGVNIQKVKRGAKEHTIKFDMKTMTAMEMERLKHELAGVLNVLEPVKITYGDEPDKYYMGMPVDEITPDNITRWFQRSELKILIPDGVAHSTAYKRFDNPKVEADKIVFDLVNNGNEEAEPIITVKHNAENGYIGVVNAGGALEVGNRQEADTEQYKRSEILFDYVTNDGIVKGFSDAKKESGALRIENNWGRPHLALAPGNSSGTISWEIPADSAGQKGSLNEYLWWRQICWLGAANEMGFMKINFKDSSGQFIYGVEMYKRWFGLGCDYNFLVRGNNGPRLVNKWQFYGTHHDHQNPFNAERGWSDIQRRDDVVQVFWWGTYPKFHVPEIKGIKTAQIQIIIGAIGNNPMFSHLYLDSIVYRKDFVTGVEDVPNRYRMGSVVVLNSENDTVTVDGNAKAGDVVDAPTFVTIPPGKSQLEMYFSSWIKKKPTVTINFEERY